ncbi:Zinc finger protein OZF [Frankliniella fusca]|uniref:Zinc finger protein OZF n=1 Tax=Frankliniella fusca TaxID=407009 RepID=A0AAE1LB57_9NEOP|nr:Zinc finger protein OZF [Frankliniella fusca]
MEQHQRYIGEHHYTPVTSDHYIQPAWLCVPQIKVEDDPGAYHCQASYTNSGLHSVNSRADFIQSPSVCNTPFNKEERSVTDTCSDFCANQKMMSTSQSNIYTEENMMPLAQGTNQSTTQNLCLNQANGATMYLSSNEERNHEEHEKSSKSHNSTLWSNLPRESEQVQNSLCQRGVDADEETNKTMDVRTADCDEYDSRHAFDLTCRNKSMSEEECSNDNSFINDDQMGNQTQAKCAPKPQTCKICGKVLSSPSSYYVHMKLHSGNKPYACTMCEASFCRKPYLEVHMRTHTGERPFVCGTCNKRFTQKSSLNTHKRVHTGERPYSCDICHKTFAVKSYVTAHRWSHVSEKPLGCQRCALTFTSKNLFALHIRTHTDQNHKCHICGRTFMKDSYLIRHQNKVHRESNMPFPETSESR